jgi:Mce-associated membrane protein
VARTTAEKPPDPAETEPVDDTAPAEDTADTEVEAPAESTASAEPDGPDGEDTAEADPEDSEGAEVSPGRRWWRPRIGDPVLLVATVLVVLAAACAAYFGWSWFGAAHDDSLAYSRDRDTVLRAAEQGVQNMNTLDYRKVDQGMTAWEDSSTGALHQELVQGRGQFTSQVQLAKTITTAKILDGAVTELDDHAGKAGAIVAVQITVTPPKGTPTTKQSRMRAELTRTPSGWKLSALGQAAVGTTSNGG